MKMGAVIAIAAAIWVIGMVTGSFNTRMLFAILFLLLIGAIYPPLGIGIGSVAIVYLLLVKGQKVTTWITSKVSGGGSTNG